MCCQSDEDGEYCREGRERGETEWVKKILDFRKFGERESKDGLENYLERDS